MTLLIQHNIIRRSGENGEWFAWKDAEWLIDEKKRLEEENAALKDELFDKHTVELIEKCQAYAESNFALKAENKKLRDLLMDDAKVMSVEILGLHDSECTDTDETKDCLEEFRDCDLCEFLEPCSCPACTVARKYINQP